ncbi:general secretion pathway protein GspB [Telluria mixta]|nr:general secretion pathway protein GspB [Telluria mixta]WEM96349.1 general secretion pathway protein GspB [Telluria mixta]
MSYILEALKKAQAERQLGNAPTIHAPPAVTPAPAAAAASRRPLFIGLGAGALVVVAGALVLWRPAPAPAPAPQAVTQRAPAPAAPAPEPLVVSAPPAPAPVPAPVPTSAPVRERAPAPPVAVAAPAPAPVAKAAPEDNLPFLQQLPDAQQRDIPRVTFGGYMYSANAADRLLIVDKALRHEGEEVAPGLVLEKLLPKTAVMNFRGIRYRVAY